MDEYIVKVKAIQWHHGDNLDLVKESKDTRGFYGMYKESDDSYVHLVVPDGDWIVEFSGVRKTFSADDFEKLLVG